MTQVFACRDPVHDFHAVSSGGTLFDILLIFQFHFQISSADLRHSPHSISMFPGGNAGALAHIDSYHALLGRESFTFCTRSHSASRSPDLPCSPLHWALPRFLLAHTHPDADGTGSTVTWIYIILLERKIKLVDLIYVRYLLSMRRTACLY